MTHANALIKLSLSVIFMLTIFLLTSAGTAAQSRDRDSPTVIASLPIRGNLGTGTYYYQIPEALITEGAASARLNFTPPDGGGSLTANFSGTRCCEGEATLGESTGYAHDIGLNTTFNIPRRQNLLVTIDVSVADKHTIRFSLAMAAAGGTVVVTPPAEPTEPRGPVCTDLGVIGFTVIPVTSMRNKISGEVFNITTTHHYKGYARRQWVEVRDITDSETRPRIVARIFLPELIDSGRRVPFATLHDLSARRRTRYEIRLNYSHLNASDESQYNDDCNTRNNISQRQLIGPFPTEEDRPEVTEAVPIKKP
jgi:hypothetical protein